MATKRWWRIDFIQEAFGVEFSSSWDYTGLLTDPPDDNLEVAAEFIADKVPLVNDLQHTAVSNVQLRVENRTDGYGPTLHDVSGAGTIVVATSLQSSLQLALYFRTICPLTYQFSDDEQVISRWISHGKKFISGITSAFIESGVLDYTYADVAVSDFVEAMNVTLVLASDPVLSPIVHGYPLAASGEKPARSEVYAPIASGSLRRVSYLDGRDNG